MTQEEVAAVAGKLTKAQRKAILDSPWEHRIGWEVPNRTWGVLMRKGICREGRTLYTPLGLAVRDYLRGDQQP